MQKTTLTAMMLSTLLTLPQAVLAGSMTYGIVDYPADQNGWALSDAITTDGKTGVLAPSDILSWTWTISTNFHGELIVFTASSSDFNSAISSTGLEATTKYIEVPPGGALGMFDPIMEGLLIEYNNAPPWDHRHTTHMFTEGPDQGGPIHGSRSTQRWVELTHG